MTVESRTSWRAAEIYLWCVFCFYLHNRNVLIISNILFNFIGWKSSSRPWVTSNESITLKEQKQIYILFFISPKLFNFTFCWLFLHHDDIIRYGHGSCFGDKCLVVEHAQQPPKKTQPRLAVTAQSITPEKAIIIWYPPAGLPVLSVYVMVSMVTSFTHTVTQMDKILEATRRIVLDRLRQNPFYALNLNKGICVWLWREYCLSIGDFISLCWKTGIKQ